MAIDAMLGAAESPVASATVTRPLDSRTVKITLRIDAMHAAHLAHRARSADMSQGVYVAALLDGIAATPRPPDHGEAIAALADSTQKVAAMSSDIQALIRLFRDVNLAETQKHRAGLVSLAQDMRLHLRTASGLLAGLTSPNGSAHSKQSKGLM